MEDPAHSLAKARRKWARTDPLLARASREAPPENRALEPRDAFDSLVASIVHQQVSIAAGRSIHARLTAAAGGRITPDALLGLGEAGLRGAGLSRPKAAYSLDLAQRVGARTLDLEALGSATDEDVIAALTQVKGIGVWTAKMHLLFHMRRPDVLPHEDFGLQIAAEQLYGIERKQAARFLMERAPLWAPYASLASLTLWNWRRTATPARQADGAD